MAPALNCPYLKPSCSASSSSSVVSCVTSSASVCPVPGHPREGGRVCVPVSASPEDGERGPGLLSTAVTGPGSRHVGYFPWLIATTAQWDPTHGSDSLPPRRSPPVLPWDRTPPSRVFRSSFKADSKMMIRPQILFRNSTVSFPVCPVPGTFVNVVSPGGI